MARSSILARTVLVAAAQVLVMTAAHADGVSLKDSVPHVIVTGTAKREVAPDRATIFLGVRTERPKADDALKETARAAKAVIDDLQAQGVSSQDIRTTRLDLTAVYDDVRSQPGGQIIKHTLRGYSAADLFAVRIKDVAKAGALARRALDHGANSFNGITFSIDAAKKISLELQGDAARDARLQADGYARALGLGLGRVLEIGTSGAPGWSHMAPAPMALAARASAGGDAGIDIPLAPGMIELDASIAVTFELTSP